MSGSRQQERGKERPVDPHTHAHHARGEGRGQRLGHPHRQLAASLEDIDPLVVDGRGAAADDATTAHAVLSVAGPKSRDLLAAVCDADLSNEAFPFNSLQHFHIGHAPVFAQRLSYTGELGWEIFITPDFAEQHGHWELFGIIVASRLQAFGRPKYPPC